MPLTTAVLVRCSACSLAAAGLVAQTETLVAVVLQTQLLLYQHFMALQV